MACSVARFVDQPVACWFVGRLNGCSVAWLVCMCMRMLVRWLAVGELVACAFVDVYRWFGFCSV